MRLSDLERRALALALHDIDYPVEIFGSRVDDAARGRLERRHGGRVPPPLDDEEPVAVERDYLFRRERRRRRARRRGARHL